MGLGTSTLLPIAILRQPLVTGEVYAPAFFPIKRFSDPELKLLPALYPKNMLQLPVEPQVCGPDVSPKNMFASPSVFPIPAHLPILILEF